MKTCESGQAPAGPCVIHPAVAHSVRWAVSARRVRSGSSRYDPGIRQSRVVTTVWPPAVPQQQSGSYGNPIDPLWLVEAASTVFWTVLVPAPRPVCGALRAQAGAHRYGRLIRGHHIADGTPYMRGLCCCQPVPLLRSCELHHFEHLSLPGAIVHPVGGQTTMLPLAWQVAIRTAISRSADQSSTTLSGWCVAGSVCPRMSTTKATSHPHRRNNTVAALGPARHPVCSSKCTAAYGAAKRPPNETRHRNAFGPSPYAAEHCLIKATAPTTNLTLSITKKTNCKLPCAKKPVST
jgi:hypothetical protein